jgi:hypothetical protein
LKIENNLPFAAGVGKVGSGGDFTHHMPAAFLTRHF